MPDEPTGVPATAESEPGTPPAPAPPAAADAPPERDWVALLDEAPDDIVAKHRRVQGIAGSHAERLFQRRQQEWTADQEAQARKRASDELEAEARDNPLAFSDRFLGHREAEKARERIQGVESNAQKQIMTQVGEAFHEFEEWGQITDEERSRLATALQGVPDNKVIAVFNKTALNIIADRRAEKRLQDRLPQEQEAWKKQWEAERLTSEGGPDLRRPSSTTRKPVNWQAMSDEDFNKWWKQRHGR